MKRIGKLLLLTALLTALLAVSAFAADFTHCADALKELGLFQGSQNGYELDRAPTRVEAGVMLVRLLGQEETAKANSEYTAPFTDVKPWAYPYVQYLYDHGLTKGKGDGIFGSDDPCTAQMYATFLLRALGYSDSKDAADFSYATALDFAKEKGVVDPFNCDADNFLRDHMAAMSYTALATAPKSGEADLLSKLAASGVVQDAKGYDQRFAAYRAFSAESAKFNASDMIAMDMDLDATVSVAGQSMDMDMNGNIACVVDKSDMDKSQMALDLDLAVAGGGETQKSALQAYYKDGSLYLDQGEAGKYSIAFSLKDIQEQIGALQELGTSDSSDSICMYSNVTAATEGGTTTYTASLNGEAMNGMVRKTMDTMMQSGLMSMTATATDGADAQAMTDAFQSLSVSIDKADVSYIVTGGALTGLKIDMAMKETVLGQSFDITILGSLSNIRTSGVTVTLPDDLDSYGPIAEGVSD